MPDAHLHDDDHPELPVDSDIEASPSRPAVRPRPLHVALVALGGAAGTLLRYSLAAAVPAPAGSVPWATLATNLIGAFALGAVLEALAASGAEERRHTLVRLAVGTGLIGGFTTYSTFAVGGVRLLETGHAAAGLAYMAATLIAGLACSWCGIAVGSAAARARRARNDRRGHGADRADRALAEDRPR